MNENERSLSADDVDLALGDYAAAVRARYGRRLRLIVLFGSRARGDARPDSDADVAVVLEVGDCSFWTEKIALADLAYEVLMRYGLVIQPWPIANSAWAAPATPDNRELVEAVKRDARRLPEAA